jgi:hypothetical protein
MGGDQFKGVGEIFEHCRLSIVMFSELLEDALHLPRDEFSNDSMEEGAARYSRPSLDLR